MRLVDDKQGPELPARICDLGDRSDIPVHREHEIGHDDRGSSFCSRKELVKMIGISVGEDRNVSPRGALHRRSRRG